MRIVKTSEKVRPWRLVDNDGRQVMTASVVWSADCPAVSAVSPVGGRTRNECVQEVLSFLARLAEVHRGRDQWVDGLLVRHKLLR